MTEHPSEQSLLTDMPSAGKRVLIVTSVEMEREAVLRGLDYASHVDVIIGGVGIASASARTAAALAKTTYDLVVSAGIGGGFAGRAPVGSLVLASELNAADLGAETPDGFTRLDDLGFGTTSILADGSLVRRLEHALLVAGISVAIGPVLTVSTVTGTAETAREMVRRFPDAAAEAMEGFGVATAAQLYGLPVLEIRGISNVVGPRDRSAWRIPDALAQLTAASKALVEVLT